MSRENSLCGQLDEKLICNNLSLRELDLIEQLQVLETTSSTNDRLMEMRPQKQGRFSICVANQQTSGRGRSGKPWQSPPDANIYLSVGVSLNVAVLKRLNGLSLSCGVVLARLLESWGVSVGLKWPNDILVNDKKIAGILVETRLQSKQLYVVVGVGVNVKMSEQAASNIDQPWIDLDSVLAGPYQSLERNDIVSQIMKSLILCLQQFSESGFEAFAADWKRYDMLTGRDVIIKSETEELSATVLGFNSDYSLRVKANQQEKTFYAADIKLKIAEKC